MLISASLMLNSMVSRSLATLKDCLLVSLEGSYKQGLLTNSKSRLFCIEDHAEFVASKAGENDQTDAPAH